jgi:hypothetical protein
VGETCVRIRRRFAPIAGEGVCTSEQGAGKLPDGGELPRLSCPRFDRVIWMGKS